MTCATAVIRESFGPTAFRLPVTPTGLAPVTSAAPGTNDGFGPTSTRRRVGRSRSISTFSGMGGIARQIFFRKSPSPCALGRIFIPEGPTCRAPPPLLTDQDRPFFDRVRHARFILSHPPGAARCRRARGSPGGRGLSHPVRRAPDRSPASRRRRRRSRPGIRVSGHRARPRDATGMLARIGGSRCARDGASVVNAGPRVCVRRSAACSSGSTWRKTGPRPTTTIALRPSSATWPERNARRRRRGRLTRHLRAVVP